MRYDWKRPAAAVLPLAVLAALCTGCGGDTAPETRAGELRAREPQVLGLLLPREDALTAELKTAIQTETEARTPGPTAPFRRCWMTAFSPSPRQGIRSAAPAGRRPAGI